MRILVFGAGVLGCNLVNNLHEDGKDVTLLARGEWGKMIREKGLIIHHFFGKISANKIPVIETLAADDLYDVIFVVVRYSQIDSVIEALKNNVSKNIVFVGNNLRFSELREILKDKNVMFAFGSSAGHREKDHVESIDIRKITIGNLKDEKSDKKLVDEIFKGSRYKVNYETNMGDWLLCHAASVLPIAFACYYTDGDLKKVRKDKAYLNEIMDATISAYEVLDNNGHEILPESDRSYKKPSFKRLYLPFYKLICATKLGKRCTSDHAMNAIDEMSALNNDFKKYIGQYGQIPKAWTELERKTNGNLDI